MHDQNKNQITNRGGPRETSEEMGCILVVDDEPHNRTLLKDSLEARGYRIEEAENGQEALNRIEASPPDAILLDLMMPGMDGIETCRLIKQNPRTKAIPVLMVTALTDREERLAGIKEGASDFLTKPIDLQEVILRVGNAVRVKKLMDELQSSYAHVQKLVLRTDLTFKIIEELLEPLSSIVGSLEQLKATMPAGTEPRRLLRKAQGSALDLEGTINSLVEVARLENQELPLNLTSLPLNDLVRDVAADVGSLGASGRIECLEGDPRVMVQGEDEMVRKVLKVLMDNALRNTPFGDTVQVRVQRREKKGRVSIIDHGAQIPPEYRPKIFTQFSRGDSAGQSHASGVGLTFCKLAVEAMQGQVGIETTQAIGNVWWFELPMT